MNVSTVIGIVSGIAVVAVTVFFSVDDPLVLWDPLGILVVVGGTLSATFVAFPARELGRMVSVVIAVFRNEKMYAQDDLEELVAVSRTMIKADVRGIEKRIRAIKNPFLRLGIQLVLDNAPIDDIIDIMSWRIQKLRAREKAEAQVFRTMATLSPAFGMVGTILGLSAMMGGLGRAGIQELGAHMALAMMTTLYGVVLANLIFKPIAVKFEHRTLQRVALMNTIMQGVILLRQKRSPGVIEETLGTFVVDHKDEMYDATLPEAGKD